MLFLKQKMINKIVLCAIIILCSAKGFAQLPAAAQQLYDSAYAQDTNLVQYALDSGAQVIPTPDGESFYLLWLPTGSAPAATPLIVTLHGSHCNAFMEFSSWHPRAASHGCGILALQWYRYRTNPPFDYFPDDTLYSYLDSALSNINYPTGKALLHGFSRGSARSYALVFKDMQSGNNYFCTTISNSGDANLNYELYDSITSGYYGTNVFAGKRWNLFCGALDTIVGCVKMTNTQSWLQSQGAVIDIFIQDPNLNHDGFQLFSSSAYKDSILNNYLSCYNQSLSVNEQDRSMMNIFPNPFSAQTTLQATVPLTNATLTVVNYFGQTVAQIKNINGQTITFNRGNLASGLYFVWLTEQTKIISLDKLVITN